MGAESVWEVELTTIADARARALAMGGEERVRRQHENGKLTVRERLEKLLDPDSFLELGMLATQQSNRTQMEGRYTAADGLITGYGRIEGREVLVGAEDFTVMGGSEGRVGGLKRERMLNIALQRKLPVVWLLDGVGARTGESLRGSWVGGTFFLTMSRLSGVVPQIGLVLGPCAGGPALMAPLQDFIVMVQGLSMLAAGGPPVVEAATGEKVTKEELGGSQIHCHISGVADNEVQSEEEAFSACRRYLSYFPPSSDQLPPLTPPEEVQPPPVGDILSLFPKSSKRAYDMRQVLDLIFDRNSRFDIKPDYAPNMLTCLARIGGHSVGILANQPLVKAGIIDAAGADKATHFMQLCDAFHIPLIFFADVPGFMTGRKAEQEGTLRRGLRMAHAMGQTTVPMVSIVVRKAFGMGGVALCGSGMGQILTLAWPTAEFGTMPLSGAVTAAHKRDLEAGLVTQKELEDSYAVYNDILGPLESFQVDDIVHPNETRDKIIRVLDATRSSTVGVHYKHSVMP
jgi:acetyl-CoA carboxylase carboxyltransferase component